MTDLIFSLVLYKHSLQSFKPLLISLKELAVSQSVFNVKLFIVDNSGALFVQPSSIQSLLGKVHMNYHVSDNIGFARANNLNFDLSRPANTALFIVVNPDISFEPAGLVSLLRWIMNQSNVSCVSPLIHGKNGSIQMTVKTNPTFLSLLLGRFSLLRVVPVFASYYRDHINSHRSYLKEIIHCSYLSGCFLIIPAFYYRAVSGFDDRYFLHLEDADLTRRLSLIGSVLHNPTGAVFHGWDRGSHRSLLQTIYLFRSYLLYIRKWGFVLY